MGAFLSFILFGIYISSNSGTPILTPPNVVPETPMVTNTPTPKITIPPLTEDEYKQALLEQENISKMVTVADLDKDPNSYLSKYVYNSKDDSGVIRISFQCVVSSFPKEDNGNPLIACNDLKDWILSFLFISPDPYGIGIFLVDVTKVNSGDRIKVLGTVAKTRWVSNRAGQKLYIPIVSPDFFIDLTNGYHN